MTEFFTTQKSFIFLGGEDIALTTAEWVCCLQVCIYKWVTLSLYTFGEGKVCNILMLKYLLLSQFNMQGQL